jgi:hypothetical protein
MRVYNLGFISDEAIFNHVKDTVSKYRFGMSLKQFTKNLPDPIKLTFDSKVYRQNPENTVKSEMIRQLDKSNTNHIGYFHQDIFKHIGQGWMVPKSGYDVVHLPKKLYVEIKNKHNTMNSSSSQKTYMRMQKTLLDDPEATCLLVEVIAKNSQDAPWKISLDGQSTAHPKIRRLSMDKFYERVTGDAHAFKKLCLALPSIIDTVATELPSGEKPETVLEELRAIDGDLLKSLFRISFKEYEGFDDFAF